MSQFNVTDLTIDEDRVASFSLEGGDSVHGDMVVSYDLLNLLLGPRGSEVLHTLNVQLLDNLRTA